MAEADWTSMTGTALTSSDVVRGVTNAFTPPNGVGNTTVFGFHAITTQTGVAGYFVDLANFNPIAGTKKGGSIRAAMKRYSAGTTYAPFMGLMIGTDPATANGYFMGLSEGTSYNICMKKGLPSGGFSLSDSSLFRTSTDSFTYTGDSVDYWMHLRLDVLVNPHGEVVLDMFESDLSAHQVTAPSWTAITGMDQFVDDSLAILTDSTPLLTGFYAVFGHYTSNLSGSISMFDQLEVHRQTSP